MELCSKNIINFNQISWIGIGKLISIKSSKINNIPSRRFSTGDTKNNFRLHVPDNFTKFF